MSLNPLISVAHESGDGRNITVLLEKEGYAGSPYSNSVKLGVPAYTLDFVGESEINSLGAQVYFITSDSSLIALLQTMRFGDERDGRITIKQGTNVIFQGYVIPDAVSVPLTEQRTRTFTIGAKDRTRSLDEEWLIGGNIYTGNITLSVLVADILASTGIPFTEIAVMQTWRPGRLAFSGDPYSIKIPARNFYNFKDDGSIIAPTKKYVLEQVLGITLNQLVQWDGKWYITQPSSHFSAGTVQYHLYNASGTHTGTSTFGAYIDLTDSEWLRDTDEGRSKPRFRRADATYAYGEIDQQLTNGQFALWDGDIPRSWTVTNARTWRGLGRTDFFSLAIEGTDISTLPFYTTDEDTAVGFSEQSIQVSLTANSYELRLFAGFGVFQFQDGTFREYPAPFGTPERTRSYVSVRLVDGANTYWLKTDGTWTIAGAAEVKHEIEIERLVWKSVTIRINTLPATGLLYFRLYQGVHTPIQLADGSNPHAEGVIGASLWDDVELAIVDLEDEGTQAITYGIYDSSKVEGEVYKKTFVIGDGPFVSSPGAIKYADSTATGDWRPLANATEAFAITELTAREFMRQFRNAQATIAFHISTPNLNVTPVTAYKFGSKRYWPISLTVEQPSGRATIVAREIRDDGVPPDRDARRDERVQISRAAEGVAIYEDLNPRIQNAFTLFASARTNAVIQSGLRSSIPIDPVDSIFPAETPITLVDSRTGNSFDLTVSDNYGRFEPILRIEEYDFPQDVDTGSYIIIAPAHALHRIAITENAFNRTMRAGRICALTSAIAATVTSLGVTPTRRDIAQDTVLQIVEGLTGSTDVSDAEQTVQVSAFVEEGSEAIPIYSVRVDAPAGAHVTEDNQQLFSFFLQNPDKIQLGIERQREGSGWTTLTSPVSGAAVTSLAVEELPSDAKSGDVYVVIHKRTGDTVPVTLNADVFINDVFLSINAADFSQAGSAFPIGSRVRLSDQTTRSELIIQAGLIAAVVSDTSTHTSQIASLELRATDIEATVVLKATASAGQITKLALVALSASVAGGSAITLRADQINIDGTTIFTAGYDPTERADSQEAGSAPTTRSDGSALQIGDIYFNTADGRRPWVVSSIGPVVWTKAYTSITGGDLVAATITADKLNVTTLDAITANMGTLTAGTITGSTFKTSTGAKRTELRSSDNEMEFFESGASVVRVGGSAFGGSPGIVVSNGAILGSNSAIINQVSGTGLQAGLGSGSLFISQTGTTYVNVGTEQSGGVLFLDDCTADPGSPANKLYAKAGALFWNGVQIS